jgi:copper chaperone CopZ
MTNRKTEFRFHWLGVAVVSVMIILGLTACRTQDVRSQTIKIPDVKTEAARVAVSNALAQLEGVFPPSIRFEPGTVIVTYDSMKLALKNMEFAIADVGFSANDTPANAAKRAALPASMRD